MTSLILREEDRKKRVYILFFFSGFILILLKGCIAQSDPSKVSRNTPLLQSKFLKVETSQALLLNQNQTKKQASENEKKTYFRSFEKNNKSLKTKSLLELKELALRIPTHQDLYYLAWHSHKEEWTLSHTLRIGPIPDYAPIYQIRYHHQLHSLEPQIPKKLQELFPHLTIEETYDPHIQEEDADFEDSMLTWMRDYQPSFVRSKTGKLSSLSYLSHNVNRTQYKLHSLKIDQRKVISLLHENGNLIVVGPWIFISKRILDENAQAYSDEHLIRNHFLPRGPKEIISRLAKEFQVSKNRIIVLPSLPHEATGHVDIYLMGLNDHQVVIPKIQDEQKIKALNSREFKIIDEVQAFLDQRAIQISQLGLDVIRLPMIPPLRLPALDEPEGNFDVIFLTPSNGLLINQRQSKHVLLPQFSLESLRLNSQWTDVNHTYKILWQQVFESLGWTVNFIDSTHLSRYLGLIHCVTSVVPDLPTQKEWLELKKQSLKIKAHSNSRSE